jgi:hypothetical protein
VSPTRRDAVDVWELDTKQISDQLDRIDEAERAILKSLNCPTDLAAIYAILMGKQPPPWPKRTAERDRHRARVAMFALRFTDLTRLYLDPAHENPRLAAFYALQAGACAGDIVIKAADEALGVAARASQSSKGRKRGAQIAHAATRDDKIIERLVRQWRESDELQAAHGYRSPVPYVQHKIGRHPRVIQRAIKRLNDRRTRQ